jgi:peptidoglycan-associated lipoprotein
MRKNLWLVLAFVLILPALLFTVSCAKEEVVAAPEPEPQAEPAPPEQVEEEPPPGPTAEEIRAQEMERALMAAKLDFETNAIYFEFDSAALLPMSQQVLTEKADLLMTHPDISATVAGHCDERGTDAYNMALGQRRADAAKEFLVNLGVNANQLNTISYGEEQPADPASNEEAWSKNRRAEFSIN